MPNSPFPIVAIKGGPQDRGQQYGYQCRALIGRGVDIYQGIFKHASNLSWNLALKKANEFTPFIREYDAEIMEEIEGIAEGSGRLVEEILALNIRNELLFLIPNENRRIMTCCTSLAVTSNRTDSKQTVLGQNWDWYTQTQDLCVILVIKQEGRPKIIQFVEAGIIAKMGFNTAGIGLCTNVLVSDKWRVGVPYHVILRRILNAESMADAISAVTTPRRASSGNYLIGHINGEAINIEAAPKCLHHIFPDDGIITHTNHFKVANPKIRDLVPYLWPDTLIREQRAREILTRCERQVSIGVIRKVLRDHFDKPHSICAHRDEKKPFVEQSQTNASIIMNLNEQILYIAKGPPCEHDYRVVHFNSLL